MKATRGLDVDVDVVDDENEIWQITPLSCDPHIVCICTESS